MSENLNEALESFLDATASRTATPGGGAVASLVGALGVSLSRMVTAYSVGRKTSAEHRAVIETYAIRLHRTDQLLRALIPQDSAAYESMTGARREAKEDGEKRPAYQRSVLAAIAVSMEVAGLASDALAVMDQLKTVANRYLLSDLAAAAAITGSAARAAEYMVLVNMSELEDEAMRGRLRSGIERTLTHCRDHERSIERFVRDALESS